MERKKKEKKNSSFFFAGFFVFCSAKREMFIDENSHMYHIDPRIDRLKEEKKKHRSKNGSFSIVNLDLFRWPPKDIN